MKLFSYLMGKHSELAQQSHRHVSQSSEGSVRGEIGYFNLEEWWLQTLSQRERDIVLSTYQPLGGSSDSLINGEISHHSGSAISLLTGLAGWFYKPENVSIAVKALEKAESLSSRARILDRHFLYQQMIDTFYKFCDLDTYLEKAADACRKQIALAPKASKRFLKEDGEPLPSHKGFEQLSAILWNQGRVEEAIQICETALAEGWSGYWSTRIEKYKKAL